MNSKNQYCSIDFFKLFAAIIVVAVHTHPFEDCNSTLYYIVSLIIPFAVPFFFSVSGYFYTQKLEMNQKCFLKYIKRVFVPYFFWSIIYFLISIKTVVNMNEDKDILWIAGYYVKNFLTIGGWYHLWYFPAVIFAVCFTTLLFKIKCEKLLIPISIILYTIDLINYKYRLFESVDFKILRIFLEALPFFVSGYIAFRIKDKISGLCSNAMMFIIWGLSTAIWVIEEIKLHIQFSYVFYAFLVMTLLLLIRHPMSDYISASKKCKAIANFTYYSHPLFMNIISLLCIKLFNHEVSETPMFIIVLVITFTIGLIIYKINNKWLNRLVI